MRVGVYCVSMNWKPHALTFFATVVAAVSLASCKGEPVSTVQYGPTTATGTLIKADVDLVRRGTHILMVDSVKTYYVESRTHNLTQLEGQTISVQGNLEPNTIKAELPVLVADTISGGVGDEDLHRYEIPSLNIRLGAPKTWTAEIVGAVATFRLPGESDPLLAIRRLSGSTLPPGGTQMYIKNRKGTRIASGGGMVDAYILEKDTLIQLHFDPATQKQVKTPEHGALLGAEFERVMSTISFLTDKELVPTQTGTGASTICGGSAGLLCPSGSFCNITNFETREGTCKKR